MELLSQRTTARRLGDAGVLPHGGLRPLMALAALCAAAGFVVWDANLAALAMRKAPHNDFGRFYLSAAAYWTGADMYGWNPAIPARLPSPLDGRTHVVDLWNLNPPHFHLLVLPLTPLPPATALGIWLIGGMLALGVSLRLIFREVGIQSFPDVRQITLLACLAGAATQVVIITGQVSWYLLLPVTLMWCAARQQRWTRAGVWLGIAAAWKPFLLIFIPYLVLRRQWRALFAAAAAAALCFAVGLAVFGLEGHRAWLACLGQAEDWAWLHVNASLWGLLTRSFSPNLLFVPLAAVPVAALKTVWLAAAGAIGLLTLGVSVCDESPRSVDRAFALLLVGALLVCPLGWNYYWFLPLGPLGALTASWARRRADGTEAGRRARWRERLLAWGIAGWFLPVYVTLLCEPGGLTSLTVGSAYFWTTLSVWLALVIDGWPDRQRLPLFPRRSARQPVPIR